MGHSSTGFSWGSDSSRRELVLASLLILIAGAGWCVAFGLGYWVRGLVDGETGRSARAAPAAEAAASPPAPSHLQPPQVSDAGRAEADRPAGNPVKTADAAAPAASPPAVVEAAPLAAAPAPGRPVGPVRDQAPAPAAAERFALSEAAARTSFPFVLPEKPSFALADLKLDEPAAGGQVEQVCAVDRSLNTALTWAKSPGEAAEQARKQGKLVFLIHVSGNFEDPGFT